MAHNIEDFCSNKELEDSTGIELYDVQKFTFESEADECISSVVPIVDQYGFNIDFRYTPENIFNPMDISGA